MAVTSTTLLSSLAPSPRQIYKNNIKHFSRPNASIICQSRSIEISNETRQWLKCTYCPEFKKMLQVLLLISLESVERHFGGEFTAWNIGTHKTKLIRDFMYRNKRRLADLKKIPKQDLHCGTIIEDPHV